MKLELLTVDEVARVLGVHAVTVRRLINRRELEAIRVAPNTLRIRRQALLDYLERNRVAADEPAQEPLFPYPRLVISL